MDIFLPSSNTAARPCPRGSNGQTPDKPVCMIYVSEYLPGVFKKQPTPSGEEHRSRVSLPCCPPLTPPPDCSSASLCCDRRRRERAAALCGRRYCHQLRLVFNTLPVDWCAIIACRRKKRKSTPICVIAAQLWQLKVESQMPTLPAVAQNELLCKVFWQLW